MDFKKKITEISKKVGDVATDTYNTVADKSGKMIEDTKLKMSISNNKEKIDDIYRGIGRTIYEQYKDGEDVGKVFTKESKKIEKLFNEIEDMNNRILLNKGLRKCETCGEIIAKEAVFCSNCGKKQKPIKVKEEKKANSKDSKEETVKEIVCPQCGTIEKVNANFCSKCGYDFKK